MSSLDDLVRAGEDRWLEHWVNGPTEPASHLLGKGTQAPDAVLLDDSGQERRLSQFWANGPALIIFWRHFGCACGIDRASRLREEREAYREAGLTIAIVGQGEPQRASAYKAKYGLDVPILADPSLDVYRAYGIGHWQPEQVLFDAPPEYWRHPKQLGEELLAARRQLDRPPVDDPWRATAEFVVGKGGEVRLGYSYQHCEDFPDSRVLTTAARLA